MSQAPNQISHFYALHSASGIDRIPAGRVREKASPFWPAETHSNQNSMSIEGFQSKLTQFARAWPQDPEPKEILEEFSVGHFIIPPFVATEVCFCFRLMLKLGDRVCTLICFYPDFLVSVA